MIVKIYLLSFVLHLNTKMRSFDAICLQYVYSNLMTYGYF